MRVADFIFKTLADTGVQDVFMISGGGAMFLNDALGQEKRIRTICTHHEQGAAIAAEGYARTTGKLAVASVTTGPGGTNAITGVIGGWLDSIPILFISGQVKFATCLASRPGLPLRQLGDQEINIVDVVRPITKYAVMVTDPKQIRYELEKETLRESSREEIENKRKIAELKIKDLEDQQKKREQIAENNRMIRDAALARINMQTAKEQQLLDLKIEQAELEKQKLEQEIEYRKAIQQADSGDLQQMLLKLISNLNVKSQNNKEKIENLLVQDGPAASGTVPVYAEAAQRLTSKIMAQNYSHPMMLDKFGLISQTRSLALGRGDDAHAITVSGNYNSIRIGQRMQLTMKAAKSGYLTLLCWGSDGMVTVLSPNFADDHVLLREGMDYRFPDNSVLAQYGIKQAGPTGRDRVLSLITPEPLLIASDIHDLVNLETDQIEKLCNDLMQLPADSWCAGYCTYLVEKEQD